MNKQIINKFCNKQDYEYLVSKYDGFKDLFKHQSEDSLFKNLSILDYLLDKGDSNLDKTFIDCGSGESPLSYLLSDYFSEGYTIDLEKLNPFLKENLNHSKGNFFDYIENQPDNFFDFALDGCALTHFEYNDSYNIGIEKISKILYRKLKNKGEIVMASDILSPNDEHSYSQSEFLKVEKMIEIFTNNGFYLTSEFDFNSYDKNFNINIDYHGKFRINLAYCILIFRKK